MAHLHNLLLALPVTLALTATAHAAPNIDLRVGLTAPNVHVYESGTYAVNVANAGNRNATGVNVTIDLPRTHTSPQVYLMGTLGARDPRCSYANFRLTCAIGTIARNTSTTLNFALSMPYSTAPLVLSVAASATGSAPEISPQNNTLTHTAQLALYPNLTPGGAYTNRRCTGTNLTSFFECELFPSSIGQFSGTLEPDHTVTVTGHPSMTGSWSNLGSTGLHVEYSDGTNVNTVDMASVGGGCFEGVMAFQSGYVAPYETCIQ